MELAKLGGQWIGDGVGNSQFFAEKFPDQKLWVPQRIVWEISDVLRGDRPVFWEIFDGKLKTRVGLKNLVKFERAFSGQKIPVFVVDNHNFVLGALAWAQENLVLSKSVDVVHVDQHSDLVENPQQISDFSVVGVWDFCVEKCHVWNFLVPAQRAGIVGEIQQIRTEKTLLEFEKKSGEFVLDVDLDFWAGEMGIENLVGTIEKIRELAGKAAVVTVAFSPFFVEWDCAWEIFSRIFSEEM